jgi:hypothetical protein
MHTLIKASAPGWEKKFASVEDARVELLMRICKSCLTGEQEYVGAGGTTVIRPRPAPDPNDIHDLLGTPCGCEFWYEPPGARACAADEGGAVR